MAQDWTQPWTKQGFSVKIVEPETRPVTKDTRPPTNPQSSADNSTRQRPVVRMDPVTVTVPRPSSEEGRAGTTTQPGGPQTSPEQKAQEKKAPENRAPQAEATPESKANATPKADKDAPTGSRFVITGQADDPIISSGLEEYFDDDRYDLVVDPTFEETIDELIAALKPGEKIARLEIEGHGYPGSQTFGDHERLRKGEFEEKFEPGLKKLKEHLSDGAVVNLQGCRVAIGEDGDELLKKTHAALGGKVTVRAGLYFQALPLELEGTYKEIDESGEIRIVEQFIGEKDEDVGGESYSSARDRMNLFAFEFWRVILALYLAREWSIANNEIRHGVLDPEMLTDKLVSKTNVAQLKKEAGNRMREVKYLLMKLPTFALLDAKVGQLMENYPFLFPSTAAAPVSHVYDDAPPPVPGADRYG